MKLMYLFITLLMYIQLPNAKEIILKGTVKKLDENYIVVKVSTEDCSGTRKLKVDKNIKLKDIKKGTVILFKANIDRFCSGRIIKIIEVE